MIAGAPGIHFYALNRAPATRAVLGALKASKPWERKKKKKKKTATQRKRSAVGGEEAVRLAVGGERVVAVGVGKSTSEVRQARVRLA